MRYDPLIRAWDQLREVFHLPHSQFYLFLWDKSFCLGPHLMGNGPRIPQDQITIERHQNEDAEAIAPSGAKELPEGDHAG